MVQSIDSAINKRLNLCGFRCENDWRDSFRGPLIRCPNEHNKKAESYKGKVILIPHYLTKDTANIENIRMWCHKCSMDFAIEHQKTKKNTSKEKSKDRDQTDLFN